MDAPPDFTTSLMFPKLRENIWHISLQSDTALLVTSRASFEVDRDDALKFVRMRSFCTGVHSVDDIACKSGLTVEEVSSILASLRDAEVLCPAPGASEPPSLDEIRSTVLKIVGIWSEELRGGYIGNEFLRGQLTRTALAGWLVEMYHYIKDFPWAIEHGAKHTPAGKLRDVLVNYANQEKNHEEFVVKTLVNLGLKREEVKNSTPLVSTRAVSLLMREMFAEEPVSVLLMAALVEAQEFREDAIQAFKERMRELYDLPLDTFNPFFEHQKVDVGMGHAELLANNIELFDITDPRRLDQIINRLHDLKHAFELQTAETKSYYSNLEGKYFPRQPMLFSSL
jgi:pyrroloquinoline quinone (PQQ) biosynthesis protein C